MDIYEKLVEIETGQIPLIHTQLCIERKLQYGDKQCPGCPSELPCSQSVAIQGITLGASLKGESLDTFKGLIDRVLKAKTQEEVVQVPWPEV